MTVANNAGIPAKKYLARGDYILRELAGECVLIPTGDAAAAFNGIITLNPTARFIWEAIQTPRTFEELLAQFLEAYEIDPETANKDLAELLKTFEERHMLEQDNG
jgi:hypothetical protein